MFLLIKKIAMERLVECTKIYKRRNRHDNYLVYGACGTCYTKGIGHRTNEK